MALTVSIEALRERIRAVEQKRVVLTQSEEEGITQVAAFQLMRDLGTNKITVRDQQGYDGARTIIYNSPLLEVLGIPVKSQLPIAESIARLQIKATGARIALLTAALSKGQETILLGDVQRRTRLFTLADRHIEVLQGRIKQLKDGLADTEETILAEPNEHAIVWYRKKYRLLEEGETMLATIASKVTASANKAREQAEMSDLPDFAVEVAFQSGLIQATPRGLDLSPDEDKTGLITKLAIGLAKQIKFV